MNARIVIIAALAVLAAPAALNAQYDLPPANVLNTPRLTVDQLPAAVQRRVRKEAAGREIEKIERKSWNGRPGYRVQFKERGRNPDVFVADNGTLLRPEEKPPRFGIGTTFDGLPPLVQDSVRREIGSGEITKIDREGDRDNRHYLVDVREQNGLNYELNLAPDGKVLLDTRRNATPGGRF